MDGVGQVAQVAGAGRGQVDGLAVGGDGRQQAVATLVAVAVQEGGR